MYSCESARTKAYSNDLRWRMVYQQCMLGLTYEEIAYRLSVDPSTVWHAVAVEEHGTVDSCCTHEGCLKYSALDEFVILEAVINRPAIHLCEIQRLVEQTTGTTISESAICRFLHKNNFSCKKLQLLNIIHCLWFVERRTRICKPNTIHGNSKSVQLP